MSLQEERDSMPRRDHPGMDAVDFLINVQNSAFESFETVESDLDTAPLFVAGALEHA